ncbi:hypothetical protein LSG31_10445 [Fodinisporobacter ferrooxydans]|uniref:Uncharacterized protein n=1 Tax=Fodinisporobacter ferrooxydans TaxID=2901836 RepID=A0ABY4CPW2_9BACL|nr:hypothetical protein LSG31_10445 [Alicyclobacillaceae bacterium MYW30-H2]
MGKVLLLDLDDVCACHNERWVERFYEKTGILLDREEWSSWDLHEVYSESITKSLYEILQEPGFFRYLQPKSGCVEGVRTLYEVGFEIVFVTASPPTALYEKYEWIEEYFPFISKSNIVLTQRKDLVYGDILVDDGPHNLLRSPAKTKIVFDHAYNRHLQQFQRVKDWNELVRILRDYMEVGA